MVEVQMDPVAFDATHAQRSFAIVACWEGPSVALSEVNIVYHARVASGPIASVRWQLDPGTPATPELINDESPSRSKMSWSTDHDAACLEGTTLTFTLEPEVSEPVSLEWLLSASVVSTDPRVEELEVTLFVDEQ